MSEKGASERNFYDWTASTCLAYFLAPHLLHIKTQYVKSMKDSVKSIPSFIKTYSLILDDLEQPDITKYKCFNEFFSR